MNTSKQINIIVALVFISILATGAYTMWDPSRASDAQGTQLQKTVDRGAFLFSQNCIVCHGDSGEGGAKANRLQAAPPLNRPDLQGKDAKTGAVSEQDKAQQFKFVVNTITCGRIGKAMPTWGQSQGGTLNDEQIRQLATMITEGTGWDETKEFAIFGDEKFHYAGYSGDHLKLTRALTATDDTVFINNVDPVGKDNRLEVDNELLTITDVLKSVNVQRGANAAAHTATTPVDGLDGVFVSKDLDASATEVFINNTSKVHAGSTLTVAGEAMTVVDVNEPRLTVERGVGTTNPAAHADGADVLKPPVPADAKKGAVVPTTAPACGQNLPAAVATAPVVPVAPSTSLTITAQGTAWDKSTLVAVAGAPLTLTLDNKDAGIAHNIHIYQGSDTSGTDIASTEITPGTSTQTLNFGPLDAGDYYYQCDVHPGQMNGTLTAAAAGAGGAPAPAAGAAGAAGTPTAGSQNGGDTGTGGAQTGASTPPSSGTPATGGTATTGTP